jgi:hypothetical protein
MKLKYVLLVAPLLLWGDAVTGGALPCPSMADSGARRLIEATCRDLRLKLAKVPGATVRSGGSSFVDPSYGCTREGCVLKLAGSFSALKEQPSPDSWLGEYLETKGWTRTMTHGADGPDGTTYALHQPGALCLVEGRWNHWHDDSGEGHTEDAYEITVSCGGAERSAPQLLQ